MSARATWEELEVLAGQLLPLISDRLGIDGSSGMGHAWAALERAVYGEERPETSRHTLLVDAANRIKSDDRGIAKIAKALLEVDRVRSRK